MSEIMVRTVGEATVQTRERTSARLFFVDHWRAALIILVVLHHVAVVYSAGSPFYYVEPPIASPLTFLILLVFILGNQAWFMGALFLIAGYFTPGSYERKGAGPFIKSRLVRLGIPLLVWIFLLNPLSSIGYWYMPAELTGISDPLTWQAYPFLIGLGVAWFLALLLVFNMGYLAWRRLTAGRQPILTDRPSLPGYLGLALFVVVLALASYLLRMVIPMGKYVLGFPTLSYLPQYLSLFIVGCVAFRGDWFRRVPNQMGVAGFLAALAATILLFPLAVSGRLFSLQFLEPAAFLGNGTWQSGIYALWDSTVAVGLCLASLTFFRRYFSKQSSLGTFLSEQSYAVYLIHVPIIVLLAVTLSGVTLSGVTLHPLLKFLLLALITVPVCFLTAYLIRKIPGVSRVL
ncbi:MAG: acyltransferase family protein [Candidatus Promineifilaceae bacterium]